MNAFELLWGRLARWFHRKRLFAMDVEAFDSLCLVAEREQRSPQEVAAWLFEQAAREQETGCEAGRSWQSLTPRQRQVAAHICRGETTRQIALVLSISPTTVKTHVEVILRKFGIGSRAALRAELAHWDLREYL